MNSSIRPSNTAMHRVAIGPLLMDSESARRLITCQSLEAFLKYLPNLAGFWAAMICVSYSSRR